MYDSIPSPHEYTKSIVKKPNPNQLMLKITRTMRVKGCDAAGGGRLSRIPRWARAYLEFVILGSQLVTTSVVVLYKGEGQGPGYCVCPYVRGVKERSRREEKTDKIED